MAELGPGLPGPGPGHQRDSLMIFIIIIIIIIAVNDIHTVVNDNYSYCLLIHPPTLAPPTFKCARASTSTQLRHWA